MERSEWTDAKDAEIARRLDLLADLSGEEEALAACRRESEECVPADVVAGVEADLLVLEKGPGGRAAPP